MSWPSELEGLIGKSFQPEYARRAFERFSPETIDRLAADPILAARAVTLFSASRSLGLAAARDPEALETLTDGNYPTLFDEPTTAGILRERRIMAATIADDPRAALRRFKHAEMMRIAARDLTRIAPLDVITSELALLASECLQAALEIGRVETDTADLAFTIIGMGKLGGRELNYSSDVDVMFVHDGDLDAAQKLGRSVIRIMQEQLEDGIVFRTDADLRPEGRAGALSRTIDGYHAYYERWAEAWEYQALLKADVIAGDPELGHRFTDLTGSILWNAPLPNDALRTLRHMKSRSELQVKSKGQLERDVKRGIGGIRDIEFSIQMLQLVHGRTDAALRSPTSLIALEALRSGAYLTHADASTFRESYIFLREVEHRVQLVDEAQTHLIPEDVEEREQLARTLGYLDSGHDRAFIKFDRDQASIRSNVRSAHERAFFAPLLDALIGRTSLDSEVANERLAAFGFTDADATRAAIAELSPGISRTSAVMQQYLPLLLEWLSESPDPNLGLIGLRRLLDGPARRSTVIGAFRESPLVAERTCIVLGSSRFVREALRRHPEMVRMLGDDEMLATPFEREQLVTEAIDSIAWRSTIEEQRDGLRRFKRRKLLEIVSRDLIAHEPTRSVGQEISYLGEACLEAAVRFIDVPLAVIAMGRFGGSELSYASDLDVLFVYGGGGASVFERADRAATHVLRDIGAATTEGETFHIDADLRPEGKKGMLTLSLDGYREYYASRAEPWEIQSLLKARFVAGDAAVGAAFMELIEPIRYRSDFPAAMAKEIRRIKLRVEKERMPRGADPEMHLKLGRGSISDVEFTVQLLQLQHGHAFLDLRTPSTYEALTAIERNELMSEADVESLRSSFELCERIRNGSVLHSGGAADMFPTGEAAGVVARICGFDSAVEMREEYRRATRKARTVMEHSFYGIASDVNAEN